MSRLGTIGGGLAIVAVVVFKIWGQDIIHWAMSSDSPPPGQLRPLQRLTPVDMGGQTQPKPRLVPIERAHLRPLPIKLEPVASGRLVFTYEASRDPNDYTAVTFVLNAPLFQSLSDQVYRLLPLKQDLPLVVKACGEENAFWAPDQGIIILCTELVDHFHTLFARFQNPAMERQAVNGALLFTLTHELGHASEDLLQLKLTGMAENNADQFATLFLLAMGPGGLEAIKNAADWFRLDGQGELRGRIAFWDEHGLNLERYINLLCYLYGYDPFHNAFLVGERFLPVRRAERCGNEYQRMRAGWKAQLDGHLRQPLP